MPDILYGQQEFRIGDIVYLVPRKNLTGSPVAYSKLMDRMCSDRIRFYVTEISVSHYSMDIRYIIGDGPYSPLFYVKGDWISRTPPIIIKPTTTKRSRLY